MDNVTLSRLRLGLASAMLATALAGPALAAGTAAAKP